MKVLVDHYEKCLKKHGACAKGVDWPNEKDADLRYRVMKDSNGGWGFGSYLDVGCGYGRFSEDVYGNYVGIDVSAKMIAAAKKKYPLRLFEVRDILKKPFKAKSFDYVVMNGVLTEKLSLSHKEMEGFAFDMIRAAFKMCRIGLAFNVMSAHVDWKRDDLFHVPFDTMACFLKDCVSKHFSFRQDYGLYEYTTYVYREPRL